MRKLALNKVYGSRLVGGRSPPQTQEANVDLSKFKTSDWLIIGGGLGMLIFGLFLDWAKVGGYSGNNAFDYFFTGGIAWILVVAAGVLAFLLAGGMVKRGNQPWPLIFVAATGLGALLMLIRLIMGAGPEGSGSSR